MVVAGVVVVRVDAVVRAVVLGGGSATVVVAIVATGFGRSRVVVGVVVAAVVVAVLVADVVGPAECEDDPQPGCSNAPRTSRAVAVTRRTGAQATRVAACRRSVTSSQTSSRIGR